MRTSDHSVRKHFYQNVSKETIISSCWYEADEFNVIL